MSSGFFRVVLVSWITVGCPWVGYAEKNLQVRGFLESCYQLPYNPKTEMTDILLINAFYAEESQIDEMASNVVRNYESNVTDHNGLLGDIFSRRSITNNANIQIFRERTAGEFYRLDSGDNLQTFEQYEWEGGQFTNKYPFRMSKISAPPQGTNKLWTLYAIQPGMNHVSVQEGEQPLLFDEGFYVSLFGLPSLIRLNVILQTADMKSLPSRHSPNDPVWFRFFVPEKERLNEVLAGGGKFGSWAITSINDNNRDIDQLSFVARDGVDRNSIRIVFKASELEKKYLAYVRDSATGKIDALHAWDYDEKGIPKRFLRIERSPKGSLRAWAQYIIHVEKTTNIDWTIFDVNISSFNSVYDQRPKNPIQLVNGKVVFDAARDKYASLPGQNGNATDQFTMLDKQHLIQLAVGSIFVVPIIILIFFKVRKF